jgi:hypothetical protein
MTCRRESPPGHGARRGQDAACRSDPRRPGQRGGFRWVEFRELGATRLRSRPRGPQRGTWFPGLAAQHSWSHALRRRVCDRAACGVRVVRGPSSHRVNLRESHPGHTSRTPSVRRICIDVHGGGGCRAIHSFPRSDPPESAHLGCLVVLLAVILGIRPYQAGEPPHRDRHRKSSRQVAAATLLVFRLAACTCRAVRLPGQLQFSREETAPAASLAPLLPRRQRQAGRSRPIPARRPNADRREGGASAAGVDAGVPGVRRAARFAVACTRTPRTRAHRHAARSPRRRRRTRRRCGAVQSSPISGSAI